MSVSLENGEYQWSLHPAQARWSLYPRTDSALEMESAGMRVEYRLGRRRYYALERWRDREVSDIQSIVSPHGSLQQVEVYIGPDTNGLRYTLGFALPEVGSLFFWWMEVDNQGVEPVYIDRLVLLDAALEGKDIVTPAFFSNGWGSWNFTGAYGASNRYRRTRLGVFRSPTSVNAGTSQPRRRGHFASDMFGVLGDRHSRAALLLGFLSQLNHFGSLEVRLRMPQPRLRLWSNGDGARLDPGCSITTDWACVQFLNVDSTDPLSPYLDAVASVVPVRKIPAHSPVGWCSWYHFFQNIDQEAIQQNVDAAAALRDDLPLDVIQIDDGFQTRVGDWFSFTKGFPEGLAPLAQEINKVGFIPGLWFAPFILDRGSRIAREHPEWLLRGRFNLPVNAGFIWDRFTTALDLTHPDALEYSKSVVRAAVHEWGYPYLKLDFLYAAALPGRYRDPTLTRAQVLRMGLEALRDVAGEDAYLLGCGCPLGSAIGLVDAMRIGADVAPGWFPEHPLVGSFLRHEPDVPSVRNAIQNVITRLPLHKRWWTNDPDCLLLDPDTRLSLAEVQSLATTIALSDGMLLLSDDLPDLPQERLRIAQVLLPLVEKPARVLDWFDQVTPGHLRLDLEGAAGSWSLLAHYNWDDFPQEMALSLERYGLVPGAPYVAREFWSGETIMARDGYLPLGRLPAHGVALLAVRRYAPDVAQYLGGDLHISQGLEVRRWDWDDDSGLLEIGLERPGRGHGIVEINLPRSLKDAAQDDRPLTWERRSENRYRLAVGFNRRTKIRVRC